MEWEPINVCKWKWKYYTTWNQTQILGLSKLFNIQSFLHQGVKKRVKPSLVVTLLISRAFQRYQDHGEWVGCIIVREISIWQPNKTKQTHYLP
jgi:hypothetical protein